MGISKEFIEEIISEYGEKMQEIVCIEELSELQKELTKSLRGKANVEHITEEMAHCMISIAMCAEVHGISDDMIQNEIDKKIKSYSKK